MLKLVYQTVGLPYYKRGEYNFTGFFGAEYSAHAPAPYMEGINWIAAVWTAPNRTLHSPTSVYVLATLKTVYWPGWGVGFYRFDGTTGEVYARMPPESSIAAIQMQYGSIGRSGTMYFRDVWNTLWQFDPGLLAKDLSPTGLEGDDYLPQDRYTLTNLMDSTHFENMASFGSFAVDDKDNRFLNGLNYHLSVYEYASGKFLFKIAMAGYIAAICLEDRSRAYILLGHGVLVLLDYLRGEILGAVKIPALRSGASFWNNSANIRIAWDATFRRILICEIASDAVDGSSNTVVQGFRAVPVPTRLTLPIPLQAPRAGRIIPVMSQVVGDLNEGVGGHLVLSEVSGSGSLRGIPITDHRGVCLSYVACEGNRFYYPTPSDDDYFTTGSPEGTPPSMGLIDITNTVRVYQPDPADLPPIGVTPFPDGTVPGIPGQPIEGRDAPNMLYVLLAVFDRRPTFWNFNQGDLADGTLANARGAFLREALIAIHDIDARFGFIGKTGGNRYKHSDAKGHAVDAICFLNPDGVTGEIIDTSMGSGADSRARLIWTEKERDAGSKDRYMYPHQ